MSMFHKQKEKKNLLAHAEGNRSAASVSGASVTASRSIISSSVAPAGILFISEQT